MEGQVYRLTGPEFEAERERFSRSYLLSIIYCAAEIVPFRTLAGWSICAAVQAVPWDTYVKRGTCGKRRAMARLEKQHAISVRIETIFLFDCMLVGFQHPLTACECAYQHQQR